MGKLLQGGGGSGSDSGSGSNSSTGCTSYYQTSVQTSDPCATYVPPVSSQLTTGSSGNTTASDLLNALNGGSNTNIGSTLLDTLNGTATQTNTLSNLSVTLGNWTSNDVKEYGTNPTTSVAVSGGTVSILSNGTITGGQTSLSPDGSVVSNGVIGNIATDTRGAVIAGAVQDQGNNSAVAGFVGADASTPGGGTSIIAGWCRTRPWATNFLSKIIPSSFFDSLCTWRGYTLGAQTAPAQSNTTPSLSQQVVRATGPKPAATTTVAATSTNVIPPKVLIWAVPAKVPLGARTSIFWTSQGVSDCIETSPDGNFSGHTVQGGASTVPITAATTFSISCIAPDGTPVTGSVTVNLSI